MNPRKVSWSNKKRTNNSFRKLTRNTLIAVYALILVGGIVRASGSGMGCPDWPRCFNRWVPPTSIEQLPADYRQRYVEYRHQKNLKFAKYLYALGMDDTARKLMEDQAVLSETDFNATKTWVEYINRLVGVAIGFLIFLVAIFSFRFWKTKKWLTVLALSSFILVGFQGWIGSIVVSTNLTPWTISLHMILALVLVAFLVVLWEYGGDDQSLRASSQIRWLTLLCMALLVVQIIWGTDVREAIDRVADLFPRQDWIPTLDTEFLRHRSFSWIVLIANGALVVKLWKSGGLNSLSLAVIVLILGSIISGAGMAYFSVPPFLQPLHLVIATVTFGLQFLLLLKWSRKPTAGEL